MRTRDERFNWQNFSDTQKQEVLRLCRQRLLRKIRANKAGETEEPQQPSLFNTVIAYTHDITSLRKMLWFSVLPLPQGPEFSRFVMGYWRLMDWNMSPSSWRALLKSISIRVTTVDHADIYGGYQCEAAFGEALVGSGTRDRMEIVTKCGIATTAKPEHALGHYITDSAHIIKSAEQSLVNPRPTVSTCC